MTDCPPTYKNPQLESFGEMKYVTADLLRQFGCNDEYLKQFCDRLEYLTPPAVRKHFILRESLYEKQSYGCIVNDESIQFDDTTEKRVFVDFNDIDLIDTVKTTAVIDSRVTTDTANNEIVLKQAKIPLTETSTIDSTTRNYSPWTIRDPETGDIISDDMTCNEFWYVGFDRNRHYETRPNWLINQLNGEIPGISRAQTFQATSSGLLESIRLNLRGGTNTGTPLVVEIRRTEIIDGVLTPVDSDQPALAYKEIRFENTDPGVMSIVFDHPPMLTEGKTYAVVLLSPLSHYSNCYWLGGWNKHCHADVYEEGNAFYSWNCGYNWVRYGKDDDEVDYHWGQYAPQDFAFICDIRQVTSTYVQNTDFYLYLTPILSSPVTQVEINADDTIAATGQSITYQVSNDGVTWTNVGASHIVIFSNPTETTFVRAKMNATTNTTPTINNIDVILTTQAATSMYARTQTYYPKLNGILSADVWGKIYAPFTMDPTVNCTAEIISEKIVQETFMIIEPDDLLQYTWIPELDKEAIEDADDLTEYLTDHPSVIKILRSYQIYVLGFFTDITFVTSPAYPIIDANLTPAEPETLNVAYGEWYDFTVDYDTDVLTFRSAALSGMPKGALNIRYNPLFVTGLTNEEIGNRGEGTGVNGEVNGQGLTLDYFKEKIIISDENVETRRISLRTTPLDPIRHLYYNGQELKQDRDYTVDFNKNEIIFPVVNTDQQSSILTNNDVIEVIYTPNIDDNGISIGWYATRTNVNKQVNIQPFYIEYKA